MKKKTKTIIEKALNVFELTTGLKTLYHAEYRDNAKYPDGIVRIVHRDAQWIFTVQVNPTVTRATVGLEKLTLPKGREKTLLITEYATPPIAERLRRLDIFFIDTAGNAHLNEPPLYVFIKGNKPTKTIETAKPKRLFKPGGLKVLFALLNKPDLVSMPYRDIAKAAGVALGTIDWAVKGLREMGFFIPMGKRNRKLVNLEDLLRRWVEAYPEQLRPKLMIEGFEADNPDWWKETRITDFGACWGGEVGATYLTHYLKPENIIIYTDKPLGKLVLMNRLRKAPQGNIEVLAPFWNFDYEFADQGVAPPILVYADLVTTGNPRNIETARLIYEKYIAGLVR